MTIEAIIKNALEEDLKDGDHTSLATIPQNAVGKAKLIAKEDGIIAGIDVAKKVFEIVDPKIVFQNHAKLDTKPVWAAACRPQSLRCHQPFRSAGVQRTDARRRR